MSLAKDILERRIRAQDEESRAQREEVSRISLERYNAEQIRQRLVAERADLQRREAEIAQRREVLSRQLEIDTGIPSECGSDEQMECSSLGCQPIGNAPVVQWWRLLGRPWSIIWRFVLILGTVGCVVLGVIVRQYPGLHWVYAAAMAACVPVTICVFFTELARRVDLKWWLVLATFVLGGISSILMTLFVNQCATFMPKDPVFAGVVEEPCKGAVLLIMFVSMVQLRGVLVGLALGAAVGAGFASIETFEYGYNFGTDGMPSTFVLIYRGVLAPLMHTGWTAALGGAIWYTRYPDGLPLVVKRRWCALAVFALMVLCHCVWNSGNSVGYLPLVVWVLIFFYARKGASELVLMGRNLPL